MHNKSYKRVVPHIPVMYWPAPPTFIKSTRRLNNLAFELGHTSSMVPGPSLACRVRLMRPSESKRKSWGMELLLTQSKRETVLENIFQPLYISRLYTGTRRPPPFYLQGLNCKVSHCKCRWSNSAVAKSEWISHLCSFWLENLAQLVRSIRPSSSGCWLVCLISEPNFLLLDRHNMCNPAWR